ncbi:hypothetical protein SCA6_001269 [Theobroma cacao]
MVKIDRIQNQSPPIGALLSQTKVTTTKTAAPSSPLHYKYFPYKKKLGEEADHF